MGRKRGPVGGLMRAGVHVDAHPSSTWLAVRREVLVVEDAPRHRAVRHHALGARLSRVLALLWQHRDELAPRGEAISLQAELWQAPSDAVEYCTAAGLGMEGVVQIECTLRDTNGNIAGDERMVSVEVHGGVLLGLENGDLSDNTAYTQPQRRTFDGRLIVFVRPEPQATVRLSAPGLADIRLQCG